ncbi:hypothetical protein [Calderihabitans maritimus]|uniref:Uncharacterized protein n=1 Tax=Calderihabitans maritimus TaxID=1246530 RepID=A0A1Z5HP20_9FIRM|nr:hypothetical protein [Calderihabitans maritimus]GAW91127.1 hypothetical protein KKC1_02890 [Calderihabitans maritimus]
MKGGTVVRTNELRHPMGIRVLHRGHAIMIVLMGPATENPLTGRKAG